MTKAKSVTLAAAAAALMGISGNAQFIAYDNSTTAQKDGANIKRIDGANIEIGDEINLIGGANTVTRFEFEYVYTGDPQPGTVAVVRFYNLDGPVLGNYQAPGTVIAGSEQFNPIPLEFGHHHVDSGAISISTPGRFVWAVSFQNVGAGAVAGVDLYNGAPVNSGPGGSEDNHWARPLSGTWNIFNDALGIDNFGARVTVVPEPGTVALLAFGGLAAVAAARRRKS